MLRGDHLKISDHKNMIVFNVKVIILTTRATLHDEAQVSSY